MYSLVLYYLIFLIVVAVAFSFFGIFTFSPFSLLLSTSFLVLICWITNDIFASVYKTPTNRESIFISALILALIISPIKSLHDLPLLFWTGIWTVASKFIFAIKGKHIFNPASFAVVLTALVLNQSATWWVGTLPMLPFILLGIFIVRKIRRIDLVFYFFLSFFITMFGFDLMAGVNIFSSLQKTLFDSPILFFAFVMLTEPLTTPPTKLRQSIYGTLVGFLFTPQMHIGSLYSTPELTLVAGNIFSYLVSYKTKLILTLREKIPIAPDIYDFIFGTTQKPAFTPGQYMEWTLPQDHSDSRGNRRYFTLASSPTEDNIRIGIKSYENSSSFKKRLFTMEKGEQIIASQLAGDFTIAKNNNDKLVFIAGGIGVTPYRSMVKHLVDTNQRKDIIFIYVNSFANDFVYKDIFDEAYSKFGLKMIYVITNLQNIPQDWQGKTGYITAKMIQEEIPDFEERIFYISGPNVMVEAYKTLLHSLQIKDRRIKTDYFPGF